PAIKDAMAAKGPHAAAVAHLLTQASDLAKPNGNMAQALEKLTECHDRAVKPPTTATKTAPTPNLAAEYKSKLAEWTPALKTAMAGKGPHAADIAKLLAQSSALAKPDGNMLQALAKLTECHKLATAGDGNSAQTATARWEAARSVYVAQLDG